VCIVEQPYGLKHQPWNLIGALSDSFVKGDKDSARNSMTGDKLARGRTSRATNLPAGVQQNFPLELGDAADLIQGSIHVSGTGQDNGTGVD
jgi:hypothetical protein